MVLSFLLPAAGWAQTSLGLEEFSSPKQTKAAYRKMEPKASDEFYSVGDEKQLEEMTDRGIEELTRLIERFEDSPHRGELWLRLAELYVEKARIVEDRERRRYEQAVADHPQNAKESLPRMDDDEARAYNLKAAEYYKKFVREFPRDSKVDQALFFLGYSYFELNKVNEGARFYKILTEKYKNSPYVSESSFALAEYYFEIENWREALKYYRAVAGDREARLYIFALYKAGWCFYRMNRIDQAFKVMERVLIESRIAKREAEIAGRKKVNRLRLASEALRDLIPFYADSGRDYKKAFDYFSKTAGSKQAFTMVERLAYYYSDSGNKEAARYLFGELIKQQPNSPRAFDYQYHIVTNFMATGQDDVFRKELQRWIKNYSKGSRWYQNNTGNPDMIKDAEVMREAALRNFILQVHQTAKNSRQPYSQEVAREGYGLYIRAFPDSGKSTMMHFYYAELLFDMKRYGEAAEQYLWVIEKEPQSGYAEPATINSAIALEKQLPPEKEIIDKIGKSMEPVPFDEKIKAFEKAGELYLKKFPQGNRRDRIRFKIARLHYLHNHFDEALAGFRQVQKDAPQSKLGEYSANLILDILKIKNDYEGIQKEGKKLLSANLSPKMEGEIQSIIEESSFKGAETLEKSGKFKESAQNYEAFAKANPGSPLAATAIFNAGVNYSRAGEALLAISVLNAFSQNPRGGESPMKRQARDQLIDLYLQTGQYISAAQMYEAMAKWYPQDAKRAKYLFNAAVIWDDLEVGSHAISNYEEAAELSGPAERETAAFAIAELRYRKGEKNEALQAYQRFLALNPSSKENTVKAYFQIARLQDALGQGEIAKNSYWRAISVQKAVSKAKPVGVEYAAESRLYLALPHYNSFIDIRWPSATADQQKAVAAKLQGLEKLRQEMEEVVKFADPSQNIAALTLLGKAHWHIGQFFRTAPVPKELTAEEKKEYQQKLAEQAAPFIKLAVENYEKALESSQRLEKYNVWIDSAKTGLAAIDSRKYGFDEEAVEVENEIDWMGI